MKQRTLAIIKPDAVRKNVVGEIIAQITQAGFKVLACKMTSLSAAQSGKFYEVHKERPFYGELCDFMSSGAIVPIALEKENAVEDYRALIGSTDPAEAAEGTIRKRFAGSMKSLSSLLKVRLLQTMHNLLEHDMKATLIPL